MYRAFAFYVPYDLRNCILGRYGDKHMRMIGNEIPSNISHSRLCASSLNTDPNCCRNSLYRRFFRYFGIHVTWYLHSHFVWLKLWLSFIESLSFVNFERFTLWGAFISLRNCQTLGVHRHSRWFTLKQLEDHLEFPEVQMTFYCRFKSLIELAVFRQVPLIFNRLGQIHFFSCRLHGEDLLPFIEELFPIPSFVTYPRLHFLPS